MEDKSSMMYSLPSTVGFSASPDIAITARFGQEPPGLPPVCRTGAVPAYFSANSLPARYPRVIARPIESPSTSTG